METFKIVLSCSAMVVGIVWIAVFICALSDKRRGYRPPDVPESEEQEPAAPPVPVPWWKWLLRAPLICLFIPVALVLGIIVLPMMIFEFLWNWGTRLRARITGKPVQHIES